MGLFSGIGGIVGGIFGMKKGKKQRKLAKMAFREENPFGPHRERYAQQLNTLMDDPSSFLQNPLYKAAFDQGSQAVLRGGAAGGGIGSGNMAIGLQQFGMGFAWEALQEQIARLSGLAGADQDPDFAAALGGYASGVKTSQKGLKDIFGGLRQIGMFAGL
jgi:hypothetical protein